MGSSIIIFDKLEHAKICGLKNARDYRDAIRFPDGTRWAECADVVPGGKSWSRG
jgi:hypothetical protein